jgi:hypothetical protein
MSFGCYDKAIIENFQKLFNTGNVHILPVEDALRFTSQLNRDDVEFPLISTTRLGVTILSSEVNQAQKTTGHLVRRDGYNNNVFAQSIPIRIEYQLDIFTVERWACDEITRELIFYFYQHPTLVAHFDYGLNIEHNFNLFLNDEVVDNSDTIEHINTGVKFRNTLTFYTDDARLVRSKKFIQGEVKADVATMPKKEE